MHKKQKKPVNWGVFNDKELAEAIKKAEEGGTGASTWNDVSGKPFETIGSGLSVTEGTLSATGESTWSNVLSKPFETIGEGLTVTEGTLSATGGAGGADWNAASGEAGFIANKPFDISTENTYTVYADMSEPTPVQANKLGYFAVASQLNTAYAGIIPVDSFPAFNIGDKFVMTYDGVEYEDTVVSLEQGAPITENYMAMAGGGTIEQPLFIGCVPMGGWIVMIIDDTLPTTEGSTIDVSNYKATGRTLLSAGKIKLGKGLYVGRNDDISARITDSEIDSKIANAYDVLTADGAGGASWQPIAIPNCPTTTDGTYKLQAVVSDGSVTYSWVAST